MIAWLLNPSLSVRDLFIGIAVGLVLQRVAQQRSNNDAPEVPSITTMSPSTEIAALQLAEHAALRSDQLAAFVDVLAGEDQLLRARLERIATSRRRQPWQRL